LLLSEAKRNKGVSSVGLPYVSRNLPALAQVTSCGFFVGRARFFASMMRLMLWRLVCKTACTPYSAVSQKANLLFLVVTEKLA
jgi:hypothetical protein